MYIYICMRNPNDDTIKTSDTVFRKNIPLALFDRAVCERELETEQNCNILTPTLMAITAFLSRSPGLLKRGPAAQPLWVLFFSTVSYLQTDWICCALSYIRVQLPPSSCGRHNRTHSTRPRSRLYSDIPWADAPVIYTGAFPILTARPGRWSIYNREFNLNEGRKLLFLYHN